MKDKNQGTEPLTVGNAVLAAARAALAELQESWEPSQVVAWTQMVLGRSGRVVLTGMGKSGLVAQKIAATLASTGCPSFFLHPAEALHGDLGMVTAQDSVLALSNSGESEEVVRLLPSLLRLGIPLAAITARPDSSLAQAAGMSKQAMGTLVDQCAAWGMVERWADPHDARAKQVRFTATGLAWLAAYQAAVAQAEAELRGAVSAEVATVVALGLEAYASL